MITTKVLQCVRGQTLPLIFTVRDYQGALLDLTGASAFVTVRTDALATVTTIALTAGSGTIISNQTAELRGQFTAVITPAQTQDLEVGDYIWDAWIVTAANEKYPVVAPSTFTLIHEVTVTP